MKKAGRRGCLAVFLLLTALLIFAALPANVSAEDSVEIQLDWGFSGNIKNGSCVPLKVKVINGGRSFSGLLTVQVPVQGEGQALGDTLWMGNTPYGQIAGSRVYSYEKEISAAEGETLTETFYLELPAFESRLYVSVTEKGRERASTTVTLNPSENQQRLMVGIISASQEELDALDGMQVKLDGDFPQEAFVRAIALDAEDIFPNPRALEHLDLLIADPDTKFTPQQQQALETWQEDGGFYLEKDERSCLQMVEDLIYGEHQEEFYQKLNNAGTYTFGETGVLSSVPVKKNPSAMKYLILLLIYIFLVGPGIYLILKRKNARRYLWLAISGLSVFFVILLAILGRDTSVRAPVLTCSGTYSQSGDLWQENLKLGIQAPYNNEYQLYLDASYRLLPWEIGTDGGKISGSIRGEQISLRLGEEKNKVTIRSVPSFKQNFFSLQREQRKEEKELVTSVLTGTDRLVNGEITNHTPYSIGAAVLAMKNRVAILGEIPAGESVNINQAQLESCGMIALDDFIKDRLDFSGYPFPEYQAGYYTQILTDIIYGLEDDEVILFGIVENPDLSFQENSGYKIYGTVTARINLSIGWNDGILNYCPNLEIYGQSEDNSFSGIDNVLYKQEQTVDYPVKNAETVSFSSGSQEAGRYYQPFNGTVAFYSWTQGVYAEIENWEKTFSKEELAPYLSSDGTLRVQYRISTAGQEGRKSTMLPYISAVRKADG